MARRTAACGCVWERRDVGQGWRWKNVRPCVDHRAPSVEGAATPHVSRSMADIEADIRRGEIESLMQEID